MIVGLWVFGGSIQACEQKMPYYRLTNCVFVFIFLDRSINSDFNRVAIHGMEEVAINELSATHNPRRNMHCNFDT